MDLHPIFVHFPVALLTCYSFLEIARVRVITRTSWWFPTKTLLLLAGLAGGILALLTGDSAAEALEEGSLAALVEVHSTFAYMTMIVYGLLLLSHLIRLGATSGMQSGLPVALRRPWGTIERIEKMIFRSPILVLGALAGLVLVSIVGALGGAIVYGPEIDPAVSVIYHLFF